MTGEQDEQNRLLNKRRQLDSLRSAKVQKPGLIDFSSNDYLGLARSSALKKNIVESYQGLTTRNGSTGSRLLTGTSDILIETENFLAKHFGSNTGLLFSSGYMANLSFFSSVPQKGDTILYDELSHACIKDGARLSLANMFPFRHNNLEQLEQKLKRAEGQTYIACESVYSMDGDFAPLTELAQLAKKYDARLVVDEAHSTGVFGEHGSGLVHELRLSADVYAVIYTFGKAMGVHGAFLAVSERLKEFIINFARPFIYTTAPSDFEAISIRESFLFLSANPELREQLHQNIKLFQRLFPVNGSLLESDSAIQALITPGNKIAKTASTYLADQGFDVKPILSPTVKSGTERLRICLHTFNSKKEIEEMVLTLNDYISRSTDMM